MDFRPAIAVDSSGNMSVVGNLGGTADFPVTIANSNPSYAFLAKISGTATSPFTWSTPTSINFGSQPVGVSTTVTGPATVTVRNISSTAGDDILHPCVSILNLLRIRLLRGHDCRSRRLHVVVELRSRRPGRRDWYGYGVL